MSKSSHAYPSNAGSRQDLCVRAIIHLYTLYLYKVAGFNSGPSLEYSQSIYYISIKPKINYLVAARFGPPPAFAGDNCAREWWRINADMPVLLERAHADQASG